MPAPAVIPAPIAYINAAAVKGFVVAFGERVNPVASSSCFTGLTTHLCSKAGPEPSGCQFADGSS